MNFHKQFYRMEPEMTINDLVAIKQYKHKSTDDFMMRFRKTRMRCQFPINHVQLITIAQKALRLPLRKKFFDVQFNELQELVIAATKYEKLLIEEQQAKYSSKTPLFYKNKGDIHQMEFKGMELEGSNGCGRDGIDMCAMEITIPFKPLIVKGLAAEIYEELVRAKAIMPDSTKKLPKPEELRGKKYCKLHYTFNHSITNCVQFRDWIQDLIVKGKLLLEKPQANIMVDTDHFPEINMINLTWAEKWKGKATWEVKAEMSKCQCECKLEVPAARAIIDQELIRRREKERLEARISIMRIAKKETSRNVFQRLENDSQPKGLSEVFRNYEASEKVEDREAKMPRWVDVRLPQLSYTSGDVRMKERTVNPVTKKKHA
ncbi:hypothetical protein D8674_030740 [Pyrus ussuriensis x Pyrus communis]|uniref:S2-RNase n=1 Tax=Pyrus ussuriensis x Pyrus communis TaxID=2448454 RepID=A0A5N5F271_9ROSA|nr:hypothetical protein D8674_030740 [Pyrus ussuriensis x Pyrus communis]